MRSFICKFDTQSSAMMLHVRIMGLLEHNASWRISLSA